MARNLMLGCIDGANPFNDCCGFIDAGNTRIAVPNRFFSFSDIPDECDSYLYVDLDLATGRVSLELQKEDPAPADEHFRRLIARIVYVEGNYRLVQEQHGPIIENYHVMLGGLSYGE